jgi:hypothetical protein
MSHSFQDLGSFPKPQRMRLSCVCVLQLISTTQMHVRSLIVPIFKTNKSRVNEGTEGENFEICGSTRYYAGVSKFGYA